VPIIGTSVESIATAENRELFNTLLEKLKIQQPPGGIAFDLAGATKVAHKLGYPVLVRPSFVLGGRAMEIVYDDEALAHFMTIAVEASGEHPVLIDKFLDNAIEMDVDAVADHTGAVVVAGLMEHIEEAGIHSGDSACALPPHSLKKPVIDRVKAQTIALAKALNVVGLMNVQYAIKGAADGGGESSQVYVLEVNPRASRTVPFVSKAYRVPWAKGRRQADGRGDTGRVGRNRGPQAEAHRRQGVGVPVRQVPRRGRDPRPGDALDRGSHGHRCGLRHGLRQEPDGRAGMVLPTKGKVFISVNNADKRFIAPIAGRTGQGRAGDHRHGRARPELLAKAGVPVTTILKIGEGPAEHPGPDQERRGQAADQHPDAEGPGDRGGPTAGDRRDPQPARG